MQLCRRQKECFVFQHHRHRISVTCVLLCFRTFARQLQRMSVTSMISQSLRKLRYSMMRTILHHTTSLSYCQSSAAILPAGANNSTFLTLYLLIIGSPKEVSEGPKGACICAEKRLSVLRTRRQALKRRGRCLSGPQRRLIPLDPLGQAEQTSLHSASKPLRRRPSVCRCPRCRRLGFPSRARRRR